MIELIKSKLHLKADYRSIEDYEVCVGDLAQNKLILSMGNLIHHKNVTCLKHSVYVSYISYLICRKLGLDFRSAARGGLLHDFFLYDRRIIKSLYGWHGVTHPHVALENATKFFHLNDLEKDIIVKHMWPLTLKPPKYKESYVVTFVDKYCASMEMLNLGIKLKSTDPYKLAIFLHNN